MSKMHNQSNCWFDGKQFTPFENMTRSHLKNAKMYAQRQELFYHYRFICFDLFLEEILPLKNEPLEIDRIRTIYDGISLPRKENVKFERFTSFDNLRKYVLKKKTLYWKRNNWFWQQARNIDNFATQNGYSFPEFPSEYHRKAKRHVTDIISSDTQASV